MIEYVVTKFGVGNFKAIRKLKEIEFKPVTLLIGEKNSGKSSLLNALEAFVDSKGPERYLDIQPFYFDNAGNYINYESVRNRNSSKDSSVEYTFTISRKPKAKASEGLPNVSTETYDVFIKFGMDTDRIRLKEAIIKMVFENDDAIELIKFVREEKRNVLRINLKYILEATEERRFKIYKELYKTNERTHDGGEVSRNIEEEIAEMGYTAFMEERYFENGIYFPKTLQGVVRYYKYLIEDVFYRKFEEDINSIHYKYASGIVEDIFEYLKAKLSLITEAIDVVYIDCKKINIERKYLPIKYYNDDIFREKLIEYIEEMKYDVSAIKIMKRLVKEFGIAEDISIEGDFTDGYSIYITIDGLKTNLSDEEKSKKNIIALILMVLMNGKFNLCFKGDEMIKYYEPNYKPIVIENPECNLNEEHQVQFAEIIILLSKELNTQIVIETKSKVMIDRFNELGKNNGSGLKVYYFSRNDTESNESPGVMEFG